MKKLYATVLSLVLFFSADAQVVNKLLKATNLTNDHSWSQHRFPVTGDTVLIPAEAVYTIQEDLDLSAEDVYVQVAGKLTLNQATIKLSANSELVLTDQNATLNADRAKGNSIIFVGSSIKYKGSDGLEVGPAYINKDVSTFTSMAPVVLPVKFIHFGVARTGNGTRLQWATSEEVGASHYAVERSNDGLGWATIGTVKAAGNSMVVNNYTFTDASPVGRTAYYRIRQVDVDGRTAYTAVKTVTGTTAATNISITSTTAGNVLIQFAQAHNTPVQVRLVSLGGQVVAQQEYKTGGSQVLLQQGGLAKGAYVVCLTGTNGLSVARQVVL